MLNKIDISNIEVKLDFKSIIIILIIGIIIAMVTNKSEKLLISSSNYSGHDTILIKEVSPENMLMQGTAKDYNDAALSLLNKAREVISRNMDKFPRMTEADVYAVMMTCFMAESKDHKINKPGTTQQYKLGYNGFGIKCGSSWKGKSLPTSLWEVENGKRVNYKAGDLKKKDHWRQYESIEESMQDWLNLFKHKRYKKGANAKSAEGLVYYIIKYYSTNPKARDMWINILYDYNFRKIYNEN